MFYIFFFWVPFTNFLHETMSIFMKLKEYCQVLWIFVQMLEVRTILSRYLSRETLEDIRVDFKICPINKENIHM